MAGSPCSSRAAKCSGRSRRARMPPCTPGCSVLTRPFRISGAPVTSLTSVTAIPAPRRALAVPPVDTSSTPRSDRRRAKPTRPVLSWTESRARRIGQWVMLRAAAAQPRDEEPVDAAGSGEVAGQGANLARRRQIDRQALQLGTRDRIAHDAGAACEQRLDPALPFLRLQRA